MRLGFRQCPCEFDERESERRETVAPPPAGNTRRFSLPLLSSLPSSTIGQHRIAAPSNHRTHVATPHAAPQSLFLQSLSKHEWIRCPMAADSKQMPCASCSRIPSAEASVRLAAIQQGPLLKWATHFRLKVSSQFASRKKKRRVTNYWNLECICLQNILPIALIFTESRVSGQVPTVVI
jgi:hypothetical protein